MEIDPFPELKIDSSLFLNDLDSRSKCSKCDKSRKFYCYTCYLPVPEIASRVPNVKLPLKIDIIKHPNEVDGKSTAVHAGVLAPKDVTIYTYPCIPDYDRGKVAIVFPCETSKTLQELFSIWNTQRSRVTPGTKRSAAEIGNNESEEQHTAAKIPNLESRTSNKNTNKDKTGETEETGFRSVQGDNCNSDDDTVKERPECPLERVVFIDSTWNQTKSICNDERLKGLQCIELKTVKSKFWRHQKDIPDTYLSTVEAIYHFFREFHDNFIITPYTGQYDNLLFFFKFMYMKIRNLYDGGSELRAYKSRKEKQTRKQLEEAS